MDKAKYVRRIGAVKDWAPGWDAIMDEIRAVESAVPFRYIAQEKKRKTLEGFGVCLSPDGYAHIVSRGLSQIWPSESAFAGTRSGWGFELTIQWPATSIDGCDTACDLLERVAQYIDVRKVPVQPGGHLPMSRLFPALASRTASCAGIFFVPDTRLNPIQTVHGEVAFLQLVNVTEYELRQLGKHPRLSSQLEFSLRQLQPLLPFDVTREKNYLL